MRDCFDKIKNIIDFYLRQKITFSRANYSEQNESKDDTFISKEEKAREIYLAEKYDLSILKNTSTRTNYIENLYLLNILDTYFSPCYFSNMRVLDVGSSVWSYVKAQYAFFKKYSENLLLNGIELDSTRLNTRFFSKKEVAKFHIMNLEKTKYIEGDFLEHREKYDFIVWILPFILKYPLLKWGLPHRYFKPEQSLKHAYSLLSENGRLLIINQGEEEYNTQKLLYRKLGIEFQDIGIIKSVFNIYKKNRYLTIVSK